MDNQNSAKHNAAPPQNSPNAAQPQPTQSATPAAQTGATQQKPAAPQSQPNGQSAVNPNAQQHQHNQSNVQQTQTTAQARQQTLKAVPNNNATPHQAPPQGQATNTAKPQTLNRNTEERRQGDRRVSNDRRLSEHRLAPGEFIFKEGDKSEFGYVVVSGTVEICKLVNGEYKILGELTAGALFGEMAIIDNGDRSASARAKDDALLREIDETELKTYFTRSPDVALDMMRRLSQYVRSSNQALEKSVFDDPGAENKPAVELDNSEKAKLLARSKDNQYIIDEFQNPSEALLRSRMPPVIHKTFFVIALMCCIFIGWSSLSIIDTTLSAPGKLTTTVPKISVQAGGSAMVNSVLVTPGQEVKKGDVLATLDQTLVEADYNKLKKSNERLDAKIQRLELELENAPLSAASKLSSQSERKIYRLRWEEHNAKLRSLDLELKKVQSALKTAESNIKISKINLREVEHDFNKQSRLVKEGIVSKTALEEAQFNVDKSKAELENSVESFGVAQKNYEASVMERKNYRNTKNKQINDELFASVKQMESAVEEMVKIEHQRTNTDILSPVDGIVLELDGLFVGAIVNVGQVVTTLVPTNVPLTVEMDIDPKNIGNLSLGNEVSVKLSALPYQKHSDLSGKITYISEDTVDNSVTGGDGTFYRARADIVANNLVKLPKDFHLVPGMQLNGDIKVGKRRIITYFLYPVIRTIETSFQEP